MSSYQLQYHRTRSYRTRHVRCNRQRIMLINYPECELRASDFAREGLSHGVDQFGRIPGYATNIGRLDKVTT